MLDEVDVLLGEQGAFDAQVAPLLEGLPAALRLVFVTATLPGTVWAQLQVRAALLACCCACGWQSCVQSACAGASRNGKSAARLERALALAC